jgi:hypothetical protein
MCRSVWYGDSSRVAGVLYMCIAVQLTEMYAKLVRCPLAVDIFEGVRSSISTILEPLLSNLRPI